MNFLSSSYLLVCDDKFTIIEDGVIGFDETIKFIGSVKECKEKYPKANIEYLGDNSVLMPGLINPHIHLEFSANKTILNYGNFVKWLFSVIENRESLIDDTISNTIKNQLQKLLNNGTTTIGAISSYGLDMQSCIDTPLNVVYFTEVLGSAANMIDTLFADFKAKLNEANKYKSSNFIPAVAIHSPYSTHPFLIREVLKIAKKGNYKVTAHFLESDAEKEWLENSKGEFEPFFNNLLNQTKSLTKPLDFLTQFEGLDNISFTHCTKATKDELKKIKELNGSIIHCPVSNRLLTNSALDLTNLNDINTALGTDGLSSNISLSSFDELRSALLIHTNYNLNSLATKLLLFATNGGAKALGLDKGILKEGFDADIISFKLPQKTKKENLAYSVILHTNNIDKVFIKGKDEFIK